MRDVLCGHSPHMLTIAASLFVKVFVRLGLRKILVLSARFVQPNLRCKADEGTSRKGLIPSVDRCAAGCRFQHQSRICIVCGLVLSFCRNSVGFGSQISLKYLLNPISK